MTYLDTIRIRMKNFNGEFIQVNSYEGFRCQYCDGPFDPIRTRYLCPYEDCKMKNTCCE